MTGGVLSAIRGFLSGYRHAAAGSIMMAFAVALPTVIGAVGMSLDLGQAYLVRQRLAAALDASALAGASMATEEDEIREKVEDFFAMNYPEEKIGRAYDLEVEVDGEDVIVSANADFKTVFMRVLGIDVFTVAAQTIVVREVRGLEVVLVVDVTGSMSTNNNIATLRTASENFVNILFDRTSNPNAIKIGIVPYSTSVNVGPYGVGMTPDGDDFEDGDYTGESFVEDWNGDLLEQSDYTSNPASTSRWYGCVVEANDDGWNANITNNDPYPNDVIKVREDEMDEDDMTPDMMIVDHEGPWPMYAYENYARVAACGCQTWNKDRQGRNTTCNTYNQCHYVRNPPSYNCPRTHVTPLTSDQDELLDSIATFQAYGNTMGNIGMLWGYRVLSPEYPFQQAAPWGDKEWRKVIIMMTDGVNTMDSQYSAFWRTRRHDLGTGDQNERFAESCETMKEVKGVLVYTVTFAGGVDANTKSYYRNCATTPAQYYDAPSQDELIDVFEKISRELANLHIRS